MEKKYILTDETTEISGRILHRIQAVRDFGHVSAGDLGGWIEKEDNLSHEGICWVFNEAMIFDDAQVDGSAQVYDHAKIFENAQIYGETTVCEEAWVFNNTQVYGKARVRGNAMVFDNAQVFGTALVCGNAIIKSNAVISGSPFIESRTILATDAKISSEKDFITIGPIGSRDDYVTFYKSINDDIRVCVGCFTGKTLEEFEHEVTKKHSGTKHVKMYQTAIELAKLQILA